jgi:hypothetical protein
LRGRPEALEGRRMAAGTISLGPSFETRASFDKLRSALLRTRPQDDIDMIRTLATLNYMRRSGIDSARKKPAAVNAAIDRKAMRNASAMTARMSASCVAGRFDAA